MPASIAPPALVSRPGNRAAPRGGGVDPPRVLPGEERGRVARRRATPATGGGSVSGAIDDIPAGAPVADIAAMSGAVRADNGRK